MSTVSPDVSLSPWFSGSTVTGTFAEYVAKIPAESWLNLARTSNLILSIPRVKGFKSRLHSCLFFIVDRE